MLAGQRGVQGQQGGASLLDRGEAGYGLLQLVADVVGVQLGVAGGAGQGLDQRCPGRQVPAGGEDSAGDRGSAAGGPARGGGSEESHVVLGGGDDVVHLSVQGLPGQAEGEASG